MPTPADISPASAEAVRTHVAAVAAHLNARLADVVAQMRTTLASRITELNNEPSLIELLGSSIEGNVDTILHALQHDIGGAGFERRRRPSNMRAAWLSGACRSMPWFAPIDSDSNFCSIERSRPRCRWPRRTRSGWKRTA